MIPAPDRVTKMIGAALAALAAQVIRFPLITILLWLAAGGASAYYAVTNLGLNTDTADMIAPELAWRRDFIDFRESFPARTRNIVIVVEAAIPERADELAASLALQLRSRPDLFASVFLGGEGEFFERNGLLYLATGDLEALAERLTVAQPLLGRMRQRFDGVQLLATVGEAARRGQVMELTPVLEALTETLVAAGRGDERPVSWGRMFRGGAAAPERRYLLLQPVLDFTRIQPAAAAMGGVRSFIDELTLGPDSRVLVTGTVAMEHEELGSVTRGAGLAGLAALLMVACILYAALRSAVLLTVSVLTLIVGLSCTAAFAAAAVGHLNLLSVAFAVLYIGLGVDFILHVCLRLKEVLGTGRQKYPAIVETMRGVGTSLVICAATTAAGFYSFIPTPFDGVSELGVIAGTGMLLSLLVSITFLPALLAWCDLGAGTRPGARWLGARILAPFSAHPRRVIAGAAAVALATLFLLPGLTFDSNPVNLRDPGTESVAALETLADEGAPALMSLVAVAADGEEAARWTAELGRLATVEAARSLDSLVPEDQEEKILILEDLELILGPDFAAVRRVEPEPAAVLAALRELADGLTGETGPAAALERSVRAYLAQAADPAGRALPPAALEQALVQTLPGQLQQLAAGLAARPFGREALPGEVRDRWISGARELVEITPAEDVTGEAALDRFISSVRRQVPAATGLAVVHREAGRTVVRSFQLAFLYALGLVSVILWLFLRNPGQAALVIAPVLLASGATAAAATLLGLEFNFANIIALPLLLGVGVDNGIHMVHRAGVDSGGGVLETSTSRAVLASGLTTVASFGNLAFAAHLGMASMGKLLTLGMGVTLAATLVFLPALLAVRAPS